MGGYQVNNYRNNWHTRDKNCCEGCNTANNPINYDPRVQSAHAAAVQLTQFFTGLVSTGIDYAATKQASKTEKTVEVPESTTPDRGRSADVEEVEVVQEVDTSKSDVEVKKHIQDLLTKKNISNLDDKTLDELTVKYNELKGTYSDEMIALKLSNHVRGKAQAEKMANWDRTTNIIMDNFDAKGLKNPDITKALRDTKNENSTINLEKEGNISIDKLSAVGNSYMEYNDTDADGNIDLMEFFKKDLINHYQVFDGMSIDDAIVKAESVMAEMGIKTPNDLLNLAGNIDLTSEDITQELMVLANSVMTFEKLDRTDNLGLDINEVKAYHAAMANFDTQDNMLDNADKYAFEEAILSGETMTVAGKKVEAVDYFLDGYYNALTNK